MTQKRFTDVEVDKYYGLICMNHNGQFYSYSEQSLEDLLNELAEENEQLKKELFETRKDYILETYADNPVRRDEKLKALEKELEE